MPGGSTQKRRVFGENELLERVRGRLTTRSVSTPQRQCCAPRWFLRGSSVFEGFHYTPATIISTHDALLLRLNHDHPTPNAYLLIIFILFFVFIGCCQHVYPPLRSTPITLRLAIVPHRAWASRTIGFRSPCRGFSLEQLGPPMKMGSPSTTV